MQGLTLGSLLLGLVLTSGCAETDREFWKKLHTMARDGCACKTKECHDAVRDKLAKSIPPDEFMKKAAAAPDKLNSIMGPFTKCGEALGVDALGGHKQP